MTAPNGTPSGARPSVVLTITMDPQGVVRVNGPIDDKMLCYALLENARDAIKDFNDQAAETALVSPTTHDILSITGRKPQ